MERKRGGFRLAWWNRAAAGTPDPDGRAVDAPDEATESKIYAAERVGAALRVGVILFGDAIYIFWYDRSLGIEWLAWVIIAVATLYGFYVLLAEPYRRHLASTSSYFTTFSDSMLIGLWLIATGGYESPFYLLWYVSIAAVAFRYGIRETMIAAGAYSAAYVMLLVALGEFTPHFLDVVIRIGYLIFMAGVAGLQSEEAFSQTRQKFEMKRLMEEAASAEEEVKKTVSLLSATLESTADGILVVDASGKITSFNRRFVEMWRIPDAILEARDDDRAMAFVLDQVRDPDGFTAKVRELYADREAESFDEVHFRDGRVFERYSRPQRIAGASVGRVWSFRDVTERKRAEAERLTSIERLKEVEKLKEQDRFKTQFINTAAHELNTPLTPIKLHLHLLKGAPAGALGPDERDSLVVLERNVNRLGQLVQDVLDAARIQSHKLNVNKQPTDLNKMVLETVQSFQESARSVGVELQFRTAAELAAFVDGKRITQVLYNLLANALKFTPRGGRVSVETLAEGERALIRVSDTGKGLTRSQIERLFQPFSQVHDTMETTVGGTGLGLYISRGIVEEHGGEIWCESAGPGEGTAFVVSLPSIESRTSSPPRPDGVAPPGVIRGVGGAG